MLHRSILSFVILCAELVLPVTGACYFRNGTATTSDFSPCSADTKDPMHTVCCASWDTCLPNGLCQSNRDKGAKTIWRETCTKRNWDEGGCQELCSTEVCLQRSGNFPIGIERVTETCAERLLYDEQREGDAMHWKYDIIGVVLR